MIGLTNTELPRSRQLTIKSATGAGMHNRNRNAATQYDDAFPGSRADASSWYARAACRAADPDVFFPLRKELSSDRRVAAAKSICARCTVRADCLSWVLDHPQDEGIWGGLDPVERKSLSRRQRRLRTADAAVGATTVAAGPTEEAC
jgi:WhiB family transcriptional regulator, redox-sensing transcriptional regulator